MYRRACSRFFRHYRPRSNRYSRSDVWFRIHHFDLSHHRYGGRMVDSKKGDGIRTHRQRIRSIWCNYAVHHFCFAEQVRIQDYFEGYCCRDGDSDWTSYSVSQRTSTTLRAQQNGEDKLVIPQTASFLGLRCLDSDPRPGILLPSSLSPFIRNSNRSQLNARCFSPSNHGSSSTDRSIRLRLFIR